MSRRHILNITSEKKQDTMIALNSTSPITVGPYVSGATSHLLFSPTYRLREVDDTGNNTNPQSARTAQHTYAKGLREKIFITGQGGSPIRWRRIIFSTKSRLQGVPSTKYQFQSVPGIRSRPLLPLTPAEVAVLQLEIFEGIPTTDYIGSLDGKLDPDLVHIHMDKNYVLNPGSTAGSTRTFNYYTPLEHNFVYNDNEFGNEVTAGPFAEFAGKGMGNLYVYDIFEPVVTTSPVTEISFLPNTTYYWHEK